VGFLLLWDAQRDAQAPDDRLDVWRLLVDARVQRRGYGTQAMRWVIEEARRLGRARIGLSHVVGNAAGAFYEKLGFAYTGEVDGEERVMAFVLGKD
jgi:diamine N-acetyltransferase